MHLVISDFFYKFYIFSQQKYTVKEVMIYG